MRLKTFKSESSEGKPCFDIAEDLLGGNFGYIGEVFYKDKAAFIVKAVNNHDKLVEALEVFTHPDLCESLGGNAGGDDSPIYGRNKAMLKLGDFRKAAALLKELEG